MYNIRNLKSARIKSIQVHDKLVNKSVAGERTALNMPDFNTTDINRGGDILSDNPKLQPTQGGIYANLTIFEGLSDKIIIKHNKSYSLYIGGALSCEGKVIFYNRKKSCHRERVPTVL